MRATKLPGIEKLLGFFETQGFVPDGLWDVHRSRQGEPTAFFVDAKKEHAGQLAQLLLPIVVHRRPPIEGAKETRLDMAEIHNTSPECERDRNNAAPSMSTLHPPEETAAQEAERDGDKDRKRLDRLFAKVGAMLPRSADRALRRLREPQARWVRIPAGFLLILGGIFSILPVLGLWMLPLGLLLLAVDIPSLRRPIGKVIVVLQRRWATWRRGRGNAS